MASVKSKPASKSSHTEKEKPDNRRSSKRSRKSKYDYDRATKGPEFYAIGTLLVLSCVFVSFIAGALLTLYGHLWICLGLHPESISGCDMISPYLGILYGAVLIGSIYKEGFRGSRYLKPALRGLTIAALLVLFWFVSRLYLQSRFIPAELAWCLKSGISAAVIASWCLALLTGVIGGILGLLLRNTGYKGVAGFVVSLLIIVPLVMIRSSGASILPAGITKLSSGITVKTEKPDLEGNVVRLITCDLSKEPDLRFGIYNVDGDDAEPYDNRDSFYLGLPASVAYERVSRYLQPGHKLRCMVNGSFFGANKVWTAFYIAPIVYKKQLLYNFHVVSKKWPNQSCTLGIAQNQDRPLFHLIDGDRSGKLQHLNTALCGLRKLRDNDMSVSLSKGLGGTKLRCSRTSVGWSADSKRFYILIVREPDGEASSIRQMESKDKPLGGWDVRRVQKYWEDAGVPNAILFDGGDSTQLVTDGPKGVASISSNHIGSMTLGYWHKRPIRTYLPMLPPSQTNTGVLNYFYVESAK